MPSAPEGGWVVEIRGYTFHDKSDQFVRRALLKNLQRMDTFVTDEKKVGQFLAGVPDPVKGRVSHAFVYNAWRVQDRSPALRFVTRSYLEDLFGGTPGGPTGPRTPQQPGAGGEGSAPAEPLAL